MEYGIEIIESAFNLDKFNYLKKIKMGGDVKIVSLAGSGKKKQGLRLLNLSSMSAIITAAAGIEINQNIIVAKTVSRATTSITGSADIFELVGVNLDIPNRKMLEISYEAKIGVFDINNIVPKLNHIYDGRLFNIQVFAGLVGGAAVVCPVEANLINYGLTRGSNKLPLSILSRIYPEKDILILTGKNPLGESIIDQTSLVGETNIAQRIKGKTLFYNLIPGDFGFKYGKIKNVCSTYSKEKNLKEFIKLLLGRSNKGLKQAIAMEVALNLYGLGIENDLKKGSSLALKIINSGKGIKILEKLIILTDGDIHILRRLTKNLMS